jgi:hypothetical protein
VDAAGQGSHRRQHALSARRRTRSSPPRVCRCARACHAF